MVSAGQSNRISSIFTRACNSIIKYISSIHEYIT
nr:MAG TPA: hypothetical protein [Caudoviricetes sp.]